MSATSSPESIPFNNLLPGYLAHKAEIDAAVARVLASGWYILGEESRAFEREFGAFCGLDDAVGVNSGTDALALALRALDVGAGDEVITVAHTAVATVAAIALTGATPVLADIDPTSYTLAPEAFAAAITPRTKAVIVVHLYGQTAEMDAILELAARAGIAVIEDCAQAHGARYKGNLAGTMGDIGCFSFYPTKNLGAMGDGGAVVSRRADLLEKVRLLREYGWTPAARYVSQIAGSNSRLDEMQAAILRVRLRHLTAENTARATLARLYSDSLHDIVTIPLELPGRAHVWHLYVIRSAARDRVRDRLAAQGIGTGIHYPVPVHQQPAYANGGVVAGDLRASEQVAREIISLPMHPYLTQEEATRVASTLRAILRES